MRWRPLLLSAVGAGLAAVPSLLNVMSSLRKQQEEEASAEMRTHVRETARIHRTALLEGAALGHQPLFLVPILQHLQAACAEPKLRGTYVDCTFGRGGHATALLKHLDASATLVALDMDPEAIQVARRMAQEDQRLEVGHRRFGDLGEVLKGREVVAVLVNGGITTEAKNDVERGFRKGPLDLRYDQDVGVPCSEWLAQQDFKALSGLLEEFCVHDEWICRRLAHEILEEQEKLGGAFTSIPQLAVAVRRILPPVQESGKLVDLGVRSVLAALRRVINQDLQQLSQVLAAALKHLKMGGRCLLICQSNLERRVVSRFVRENEEPMEGAALPKDRRRLKKLYPLAGSEQAYGVRRLENTRLTRHEMAANPTATRGASLIALEKTPRTVLPMPRRKTRRLPGFLKRILRPREL